MSLRPAKHRSQLRQASFGDVAPLHELPELSFKKNKHGSETVDRHYHLSEWQQTCWTFARKAWFVSAEVKLDHSGTVYEAGNGISEDRWELWWWVFAGGRGIRSHRLTTPRFRWASYHSLLRRPIL